MLLLGRPCPSVADDLLRRLARGRSLCAGQGTFAGSPFADNSEDRMDAFSEILSGVKLNGAVFFSAEFSAPWGFSAPAGNKHVAELAPESAHFVLYHFLIDGEALVQLTDGQSVELKPGDVVIFPHGDPHDMSSGRGAKAPFPNYGITAKIKARDLSPLRAGGGGDTSRFVCGYMTCDPYLCRPILSGLPPVFKVNIRTDRSGHWLENSIIAPGRRSSFGTGRQRSHACQTLGGVVRRYLEALRCRLARTSNGMARGSARSRRGKKPWIAA